MSAQKAEINQMELGFKSEGQRSCGRVWAPLPVVMVWGPVRPCRLESVSGAPRPMRDRFKASGGAHKVMDRIRRRYRRQHGRHADWKRYVARLVGVSEYTVGAWRVGTMRPTPERMKMIRRICADLGRKKVKSLKPEIKGA